MATFAEAYDKLNQASDLIAEAYNDLQHLPESPAILKAVRQLHREALKILLNIA